MALSTFLLATGSIAEDSVGKDPVSFDLKDQFDKPMVLKPTFAKPVIVTVADREGSEQLADWISPLKNEFGASIEFFAIADLRSVPGWVKGIVRRGFKKEFDYSVAMDWNGVAAKQMKIVEDEANLTVLDGKGKIVFTAHGEATGEKLVSLRKAVRDLMTIEFRPDGP